MVPISESPLKNGTDEEIQKKEASLPRETENFKTISFTYTFTAHNLRTFIYQFHILRQVLFALMTHISVLYKNYIKILSISSINFNIIVLKHVIQ